MKKKTNKIIILSITAVIFVVALLIFILNYSKDDASLSLLEKKWINDNQSNVVDVSVYNDVSIFGSSGNGVIFDYLSKFTEEYGVNFNKVSYLSNSNNYKNVAFKILKSDEKISDNDILIYEDKYVIVSKDKTKYDKISDISNISLGVLSNDISLASYYLSSIKGISYKTYNDIDSMLLGLKNEEITHLLVPMNQYLEQIVENNLNIICHISDINKKYVLSIKDNNTLLNIMKKYTMKYKNEYFDNVYKENFIDLFFKAKNISDEEKMSYNANSYVFGYVTYTPYEKKENEEFVGTLSNYLSGFEDLFDVDFKTIRYDNINDLKNALSSGEIDLVFGNFSTNNTNVDRYYTVSPFKEEYVILSKDTTYLSTIRSLKDKEVYTVSNSYLFDYLSKNGIVPKGYDNTDELIRNIDSNSIIILDLDTYNYYKNQKLSSYNIIYSDTINTDYSFVIRDVNKNSTFIDLFSFYVSMINYNEIKYSYNINETYLSGNITNILKYVGIALGIILVLTLIIIGIKNKRNKEKVIKKEEKMKFIDVMTSLKNRNYLNYNIEKWDSNVIYPQCFVVIDLNNIKAINDSHGHEEGDNVIKKAASILIINQLENTDIMRTDGNEFLVYMVGYSEKDVVSYTRKIYKELKELPYGYGASIGYSMILDDIKTVDDAINEATLEMRKNKEKEKEN